MEVYPFIRQIKSPITEEQLQPLDPKCRVVQFDNPLTDEDHEKLSTFLRNYPNVSFRVYSHYSVESIKKLSFLLALTFLENCRSSVMFERFVEKNCIVYTRLNSDYNVHETTELS